MFYWNQRVYVKKRLGIDERRHYLPPEGFPFHSRNVNETSLFSIEILSIYKDIIPNGLPTFGVILCPIRLI